MQRRKQFNLWVLCLLLMAPLLGAGTSGMKEVDDGLDVFFRDTDLDALSSQAVPKYNEADPGDSKLIERGFPGAPPSIPHNLEDMLPISASGNECLTCHDPEEATDEDIPYPDSHFKSAVMGKGKQSSPMVWVVRDYKKLKSLVGARYDCVMCHTPQATNVSTPATTFVVEKAKK